VFWEGLAARGRQLQALPGNSENKENFDNLQILLALLQGIHGAETEAVQCRRILEALEQRKNSR
jgi:redox-regulated HSP33 family molecular chaperone